MSLFNMLNRKEKNAYVGKRTFTYFIPSPPSRKSGYQEKEFDHIVSYLIKKGLDIIDIKLESLNTSHSSGLWIICILGAKTKDLLDQDLEVEYSQIASQRDQTIKLDPAIEHEC